MPPSLGAFVDTSDCEGKLPPASCVVECALGYKLSEENSSEAALGDGAVTYHCYSAEDGFIGSGPDCASPSGDEASFTLELSMEVSNEITGVPSSVTAVDIKGAVAKVEEGINEELADMSLTVSGLTASVTAKEDTAPTPAPSSLPDPP